MSVNVVITPGGLFPRKFVLKDLLINGLQYGRSDEACRLVENEMAENTILFRSRHICRGMDISFEGKNVILRSPLPNDEHDIRLFYDFIKHVCEICHTTRIVRDDEKVSVNDMERFILMDINSSKRAIEEISEDIALKNSTMMVFGVMNPIILGREECSIIGNDLNKYGEFMDQCQQMDVYYAAPKVYKKDGKIIGAYFITNDCASVVPLTPTLFMSNIQVDVWCAFLRIGDRSATVLYEDFVAFADKSKRYDATHVIVEIPKDEMAAFAQSHRIDL